jgi:hypothetical protein
MRRTGRFHQKKRKGNEPVHKHAAPQEVPQERDEEDGARAVAANVKQTPSGLQMVDVRIGKGPTPEPSQNIFIRYQGAARFSGERRSGSQFVGLRETRTADGRGIWLMWTLTPLQSPGKRWGC